MELTVFDWGGMLVAVIGLAYVVRIFLMWNHVDKSMLKAKVFLDDKFLYNNWIYLFWIGTFLIIHKFLIVLYSSEYSLNSVLSFVAEIRYISALFGFASIVLIFVLCYRWYKLLSVCTFED